MTSNINWWEISLDHNESANVTDAVNSKRIGMGELTAMFEEKLARKLNVPYAICVSSGTMALTLAIMACKTEKGDEVVLPNFTFAATAHAAIINGLSVKIVDSKNDDTSIDENRIESQISQKTKVMLPVHMNGRASNMDSINEIARQNGLNVIEDASQAFLSRYKGKYLGTYSRFGCFSLGPTKTITTGQGGFIVCHDKVDDRWLRRLRNNGVEDVKKSSKYDVLSLNGKMTDIQASLGLAQIEKSESVIKHLCKLHDVYGNRIKENSMFKFSKIDPNEGEVPLKVNAFCTKRDALIDYLAKYNIKAVRESPTLCTSPHINISNDKFSISEKYNDTLLTLPSGPGQDIEKIEFVADKVQEFLELEGV